MKSFHYLLSAVVLALPASALADPGHGTSGVHWHGGDMAATGAVALLAAFFVATRWRKNP